MAISAVDVALVGSEGAPAGRAAGRPARRGAATRCRSTAAAASPPTPIAQLRAQLGGWVGAGIPRVKMKVGRRAGRTTSRGSRARPTGHRRRRRAVRRRQRRLHPQAGAGVRRTRFAELGVSWFEEPVSSDDLDGLRLLRDRAPPGMEVAAGEYGYDLAYFRRMLDAGAVDVLQADATRCARHHRASRGRGAVRARLACRSRPHCAPALHAHAVCALRPRPPRRVLPRSRAHRAHALRRRAATGRGVLRPDRGRPGLGLEPKRGDLGRWLLWQGERHSISHAAAAKETTTMTTRSDNARRNHIGRTRWAIAKATSRVRATARRRR